MIDWLKKQCQKCLVGFYNETTQLDDVDGVLHCTQCNHKVSRYSE